MGKRLRATQVAMAFNNRFPMEAEQRLELVKEMLALFKTAKNPRTRVAAFKALVAADKLNIEEGKAERGTDGLDQLAGAIARELRSPGLAGESRGTITSDSHTVSLRSLEQSREVAAGEALDPDLPLGG